jgi:hypothetical protein
LSWLTAPAPAELEGDDEEPSPKAILFVFISGRD